MKLILVPTGLLFFLVFSFMTMFPIAIYSQEYDTISNWDGIAPEWSASTPGAEVVVNPAPDEVNSSAHCFRFVTGEGMYDYMIYEMEGPVNFDINPRFRLKVLAPESGGNITLKFENYNNSFSQEIVLTPVPGQWTDLEYDFSGLVYNDLIKMVIFPDILGTTPGNNWYIDDILEEIGEDPGPLELVSDLPILVLNTYGIAIPDEPKVDAHMGIIDNGPGVPNNIEDPFNGYDGMIGIEIRGQSSQMFPKHSYGFETRDEEGENLNVELLGLPAENDWVLYAPYSDKSMLRNIVSFEMGRSMGNYCTRSVFCELVVNNNYKGVYTLMEKIKKDENRVDIATLKPEDIAGEELSGGYIIKVDKIDMDFTYGHDGWYSAPWPPYPNAMNITFQYFYPGPDEIADQQRTYIKGYVALAENKLISITFADPDNGYQRYFDVLSFIDHMLLSEIPKEVDKYRYSTYFFKEKDTDGGKLFAGPAWDFDLGFGNVNFWEPGLDHMGWLYRMVEPVDWSIMFWWKRMMEDSYFRDMAKTRWTWLRENRLDNNSIQTLIDSVIMLTEDARDRNFERWPIMGQYVWPNYDWYGNTYADEVDYFEDFIFSRLEWMDANFTGDILHPAAGVAAGTNEIILHIYDDYFKRPDLKPSYFQLNNAPEGISIDSVVYLTAADCRLILNGDVSDISSLSVTISPKAINYWLDITSSPLSASDVGDPPDSGPEFLVFEENHHLHIRCDKPEHISGQALIMNISGQNLASFHLEKKSENVFSHQLKPGFYLLVIETAKGQRGIKFIVAGN